MREYICSKDITSTVNLYLEQGVDNSFGIRIKDSTGKTLLLRQIKAELIVKPFVGCVKVFDYLSTENLRIKMDLKTNTIWLYFPVWATIRYENTYSGYTYNLILKQKTRDFGIKDTRLLEGRIRLDPEVKYKYAHTRN